LVCFSHFAGVRDWPPPNTHKAEAIKLLSLMNDRDYFILAESRVAGTGTGAAAGARGDAALKGSGMLEETRQFLAGVKTQDRIRFMSTGFLNHSDRWTLVPSLARDEVRAWLHAINSPEN
jgi:hypothetical protein